MSDVIELERTLRELVSQRKELTERMRHGRRRVVREPGRPRPEPVKRPEPQIEKKPERKIAEPEVRRSRRLFGFLVGHLQKANATLDAEKNDARQEKQRALEEEVEEKLSQVSRELAEARRQEYLSQKEQDRELVRSLRQQIAEKDAELLKAKLKSHYAHMAAFVRTRHEPSIFWMPSKHNSVTRELQETTALEIQAKLRMLDEEFAKEMTSAD